MFEQSSIVLQKSNQIVLALMICLLYTDPSLVKEHCQVLLRFRLRRYATTSDVEKAFLMMQLRLHDRYLTKFLWIKNLLIPNSELTVKHFKVVLFEATCSQSLLNATVLKSLTNYQNSEFVKRGLYTDNLQITVQEKIFITSKLLDNPGIFPFAHLTLREWVTNSLSLYSTSNLNCNDQRQRIKHLQRFWVWYGNLTRMSQVSRIPQNLVVLMFVLLISDRH